MCVTCCKEYGSEACRKMCKTSETDSDNFVGLYTSIDPEDIDCTQPKIGTGVQNGKSRKRLPFYLPNASLVD